MSWKDIVKNKFSIDSMEDSLEREMKRSLSELSIDDKKEIQKLRAFASGLIDILLMKEGKGGEEKQFEDAMKTIDNIRTKDN
tara:strand:- start:1460 stop:1705 length:246 start_codon:yes stop_codon:yes gene_type:complete